MDGKFRRAVVTGGAGFLGRRVCRRLLDQGTDVVCVDNLLTCGPVTAGEDNSLRSAAALPAGKLRVVPGARISADGSRARRGARMEFQLMDVAEPFDVAGEVDLVMHLASPASPADYAQYPIETLEAGSLGTRNALELAARKGARFVLASTSEVYGDPLISPQPEEYRGNVSPIGPRSVYDEAKRYAEALTAAYRRAELVDTAIARIFNSYGPGMRPDDGRMVPTFACQALRGEPVTVTGDGTQTRSLCHADDTVRGLLLLAASDLGGPVNIGNPDEATVGEIASRIISLAGSSSSIRYIPRPVDDPRVRKPDITFARLALGFEPRVTWREGLTETIDWFRQIVTGSTARPREEGPAASWLREQTAKIPASGGDLRGGLS
jgi:dTDP-glucose 4,6-dehydratase